MQHERRPSSGKTILGRARCDGDTELGWSGRRELQRESLRVKELALAFRKQHLKEDFQQGRNTIRLHDS